MITGAAVAVTALGAALPAAAAPDPYAPTISTECRVSVPPVVEPGSRVTVRVSVAANSPVEPHGKVTVRIHEAPGGVVWSRTVPYSGGERRVVGPVLDNGDYTVSSRFTSGDATFASCRGRLGFVVGTRANQDPDNDDDNDGPGGLLPDTGGPQVLWLVLGVGLVGAGTTAVVVSRRRSTARVA